MAVPLPLNPSGWVNVKKRSGSNGEGNGKRKGTGKGKGTSSRLTFTFTSHVPLPLPVPLRLPLRAVSLLLLLLLPTAAHADDWLAVLPACDATLARETGPVFELAYPRPGLPAVVEAGQTLIARVRLPSPLTPPPGVQQARVLHGFAAELVGHSRAIGGAAMSAQLEHRYPLEVVNVRPDGPASLVYRVSLPIPAWTAPGTYDLALSAPGGSGRARSLVRVLAQGEPVRVAWAVRGAVPNTNAIAALPIDVWVQADDSFESLPPLSDDARAPLLAPRQLSAALRIDDGLWVLGGCDSPHLRFEDEVGSALSREQRTRRSATPPAIATLPGFVVWEEAARWQPWPPADALRVEETGDRVRIALTAAASSAEIALLLAGDDRSVQTSAGALRLYPAREVAGPAPPTLVAQLRLRGASEALVWRVARSDDAAPSLIVHPLDPQSGDLVRVGVVAGARGWRVAVRFDAQHTAFTTTAAAHAYQALGVHRIEALAIAADGAVRRLHADVRVGTAQRTGCRCQLGSGLGVAPNWAAGATWIAGTTWIVVARSRRQVRKRRNRARKAPSSASPE